MTVGTKHNRQMSSTSTFGTTKCLGVPTMGPRRRKRPSLIPCSSSEKEVQGELPPPAPVPLSSSSFSAMHLRLLLLALTCSCCWTTGVVAEASASFSHGDRASSFIRKGDLPETGTEWISLHETVEFLPASKDIMNTESLMDWIGGAAPAPTATAPQTFGTGQLNRAARQQRKLDDEDDGQAEQDETDNIRENNPQYRVQPYVEGVSDYDEYQQAWRLLGFMIDCDDTWINNGDDDDGDGGGSNDQYDTGVGCTRYVIWAAVSCDDDDAVMIFC